MKKKRWLQFRLSTFLLAVAVIAFCTSWMLSVLRHAQSQREKFQDLVSQPGVHGVFYENDVIASPDMKPLISDPVSPPSKWLLKMLGVGYFYDVSVFQLEDCADPAPLLGDAVSLGRLRMIRLSACDINTGTATTIAVMDDLVWLGLAFSKIDDDRFKRLGELQQLKLLDLRGTQVSKESSPKLGKLPNLQYLYLNKDNFDDESLEKLRIALPRCNILFTFNTWPELKNAE